MKKSKEIKREEAAKRQKIYNKLSPERKLELIKSRRGNSLKETSKILNKIKESENV